MSQSLQSCQNKLDLSTEDKDEKKEELVEEPKTNPLKKRPFKDSEQITDKKLKLSPSPLMDLPNEIWMKILNFLPTYDILKNFNLTCKHFHSLATNPCAIKSIHLKLKNAMESSQYQEIVKVLTRSKTLNKLIIKHPWVPCVEGKDHGRMNHILAHGLKSNHLKTLVVKNDTRFGPTLSKKNAEYIKNSKIESLKLKDVSLHNYAMQQIGAMKNIKSILISLNGYGQKAILKTNSMSELFKTFIDAKTDLEDLAIVAHPGLEIHASVFGKFLEERAETLKKLKISCAINDSTKKDDGEKLSRPMNLNATPNLEELYYCNYSSQNGRHTTELKFGQEMPKLTKVVLKNINVDMFHVFGTQNFPVLERLHLVKGNGSGASRQMLFNILENCPTLKSVKIVGLDVSDPHADADIWRAFLVDMYKTFNVYIDIFSHFDWNYTFPEYPFERHLEENDVDTYSKYLKLRDNFYKWDMEQQLHQDPYDRL